MASQVQNKQVVLKRYVTGWPQESNMEVRTVTIDTELKPGSGDVLVQNLYISLDPYMRGRMREGGVAYAPAFELDKPMTAGGVGRVAASASPDFSLGDLVHGTAGWEEYTLVPGGQGLWKLDPQGLPPQYFLGVLGMPGLTAYVGLLDIGQPKEGETVFVSAAAGAVGQVVGQLAKAKGCRVVGSAGSDEKVELLKTLFGYDDGFNYKKESDFTSALKRYCPDGIDVYFENVGGAMLEAALNNMNTNGRIPMCGMISQYNLEEGEPVRNLVQVIGKRLKVQGFIVGDHRNRTPQFLSDMTTWLKEGRIKYKEDVAVGLENAPRAFIGVLRGENIGKQVVKIAD